MIPKRQKLLVHPNKDYPGWGIAGLCRLVSPIPGKAGVILCPDVSPCTRIDLLRLDCQSIIFNFFISKWVADFWKEQTKSIVINFQKMLHGKNNRLHLPNTELTNNKERCTLPLEIRTPAI